MFLKNTNKNPCFIEYSEHFYIKNIYINVNYQPNRHTYNLYYKVDSIYNVMRYTLKLFDKKMFDKYAKGYIHLCDIKEEIYEKILEQKIFIVNKFGY